ncbi:MAG: FG-GAP-like repeat-containing protein [Cyanobacteriota bacterium]|nr:FG-GAP-like repeat-containing protein [Cyanobacteriota bacterium]
MYDRAERTNPIPVNNRPIPHPISPHRIGLWLACLSLLGSGCRETAYSRGVDLPQTDIEPQTITLDIPPEDKGRGSLVAVDVNNDGNRDIIVTKPGTIAAYTTTGQQLWTKQTDIQLTHQSEGQGLPGRSAPGVQAADVDGDNRTEVLFLTQAGNLEILQGSDGQTKKSIPLASPPETNRWEHLVVANFRGEGDRDLLVQTTRATGYRTGRYLAAYTFEELLSSPTPNPLWMRDDFIANAHNGARVADLDGDGKEEVLGGSVVSPEGEILLELPLKGHVDALTVADVRPELPGLEVVALEEGGGRRPFGGGNRLATLANRLYERVFPDGNRIFLYNRDRLLWENHYKHQEPQNTAVGDFDPDRPGLEIWCRSRDKTHQKPFIFDSRGQLIAGYKMKQVAPKNWTTSGVETIFTIDWTGEAQQLAAAKERHTAGDVAIFNPLSGEFLLRFPGQTDRLYVADVVGDWREEAIVLSGDRLQIYQNLETNPNPDRPSLWERPEYERSKMTWNYYSP